MNLRSLCFVCAALFSCEAPRPARAPEPAPVSPSAAVATPAPAPPPEASELPPGEAPDVAAPRDREYPWMSVEAWWQRQKALAAIDPGVKQRSELAFLGDSIVEGWDDGVWNEYYARYNPVRLGLGGDKTQQVLYRIEHGELGGLGSKLVVILIGTNNFGLGTSTPELAARGVTAVVRAVQAKLPKAKILLLGILPRDEQPGTPLRNNVAATNLLIARLASDRVQYLDIGRQFLDPAGKLPAELMADFLHPTRKGYRVLAEAIAPSIRAELGH
ncbi:MAG: GDSL-type esterase/lipase family protein [Myxococcota bacterium]|nr:GDSL-type esterase/lipase family protein [Myxococcota bacterium]